MSLQVTAIVLVALACLTILGPHLLHRVRRGRAAALAFRKSEEFLDRASRLAGVGGWEVDLASNEASCSAETRRIFGVDPGHTPTLEQAIAAFAPEARPTIAAAIEQCAIHGEGWDLELPFVRADGRALWVRTVGSLMRANGKPARMTGALQDITDRVVERLALKSANERVNLATDSGQIGFWDWDIVNDTMVWDTWMFRLHGMERPAGIQTYELWRGQLHPDDRAAAEQAVRDAMDGIKPYLAEFRVVWPDGSVHHIRGSGHVTRDAAGCAIRMFGTNWDITEQAVQNLLLARAERETTAAAAQYRLLADNASDVIVVVDRQLVCRYVSPSCRDLLGYTPEAFAEQTWDRILHPDDIERVMAIARNQFAKPFLGRSRIVYRIRHRDGRWIWVESLRSVLGTDATGLPVEICSALRDVTQRVATETALRDSEERYRLLLESGMFEALYMLDPTGIVETWNAGAERVKGYTPAEIVGQNFSMFFRPEDVASGEPQRLLALARDTGSATADGWRVRKNGNLFFAHVRIDALRRDDGTLRGYAKITHDVSAQRVEEEQRAIIVEAAPNGMMIVDETGTITLANSSLHRIFGYPRGSLVGRSPALLVPEAFRAAEGALRSAFGSGRNDGQMMGEQPFAGHRYDGSTVSVEMMVSPIKTPRGVIVVASLVDVSERQQQLEARREADRRELQASEAANMTLDTLARHLAQARDLAEQANRAKSRFLAGMSHELRTPLNGILGYAQLLRMDGNLDDVQAARVDAMLGAGTHLLEMIHGVLDLSEIETERAELRLATTDLRALAAACLELVRPAAEAKRLALTLFVAADLPSHVTTDPTRLRQVLLNLLGNAAKFTCTGTVALRVLPAAGGGGLRFEIADTGPGIPADQSHRLFQEFQRLDTDRVRTIEGAGLGLSLAARITALMGGRIGHTDNPGGGSIFWVELPLASIGSAALLAGLPDAVDPAQVQPAPPPLRPLRVLVVDDIAMNRDIAACFIRSAHHEVVCVESGAEAIAAVAGSDFDVVMMDVRMPEMDGLEATRRIRALDGTRGRVPIVALTAQVFTEQVAECRKAGMDSHLVKPFTVETLLDAVARGHAHGQRWSATAPQPVGA
jgi:PAS domain S-box-containing protein